jgi:hypothetical protein
MNRMKFFCCIFAFLIPPVFANPISLTSQPLISEVYIQSPTHWYIELNMDHLTEMVPCTTSKWRLQIASLKKTYNLQFPVNSSHIAVITRASITGIPETEQVQFASYDTISIMDSSKTYIWKFPLRPVAPGRSLYNASSGDNPNPQETDRVTIGILGNPPVVYNSPFISEVQVPDSAHWAIELDYQQSGHSLSIAFPCTLSQFRMQISNSPTVYSVRAIFNTDWIAVLRPGDITSESGVLRNLTFPTTIKILDSGWNSTTLSGLFWKFIIQQPLDSSHSLINGGNVQTMRVNIGKRFTYSTQYKLFFLNQNKAPAPEVYIYIPTIVTVYPPSPYSTTPVNMECLKILDKVSNSSVWFSINLNETPWYGFLQEPILTNSCSKRSEFAGISWQGRYIDSVVSRTDTIIVPDPLALSHYKTAQTKSVSKIYQMIRNNRQVLFSVIFANKVSHAQIRILSLDGKLISTLPLGPVTTAGTYTCEWNYSKSARSGVFICRLLIDGAEMQSQKVQVW